MALKIHRDLPTGAAGVSVVDQPVLSTASPFAFGEFGVQPFDLVHQLLLHFGQGETTDERPYVVVGHLPIVLQGFLRQPEVLLEIPVQEVVERAGGFRRAPLIDLAE